jgi:hypothetical protein
VLEGKAAAIRDDARLTIKISCLPLVRSFILLNLPDELEAQTCKANHRGLMAHDYGRRKVRDVHQQWLTEVAMLLRAAAAQAGVGAGVGWDNSVSGRGYFCVQSVGLLGPIDLDTTSVNGDHPELR